MLNVINTYMPKFIELASYKIGTAQKHAGCDGPCRSMLAATDCGKTLHMDITRWKNIIRLIIFFAAKDGEALYRQQKQDRELTVAQIMNSLLPNSDLN